MAKTIDIQDILSKIQLLGKDEQLALLRKLVLIVRKTETTNEDVALSSISGIGSDIWKGTDIDKYVESEREW